MPTYDHLCSHFCLNRRRQYGEELTVLKHLVETDKSMLPVVIRFHDGGKMTFPHQILLPFMRKCSKFIKSKLNCRQLKLQGKTVILNTKQYILNNEELNGDFKTVLSFSSESISMAVDILYKDILRRVINAMANSLIQSQAMLERVASNKGVDAKMALRDRLKAYATDKHTHIKL